MKSTFDPSSGKVMVVAPFAGKNVDVPVVSYFVFCTMAEGPSASPDFFIYTPMASPLSHVEPEARVCSPSIAALN